MKTQSQKMRAILFRLYEQAHEGYDTAEEYYNAKMNILCDVLLRKLDGPMPEEQK